MAASEVGAGVGERLSGLAARGGGDLIRGLCDGGEFTVVDEPREEVVRSCLARLLSELLFLNSWSTARCRMFGAWGEALRPLWRRRGG